MELSERILLFKQALGFEGLDDDQYAEIAGLAFEKQFSKGDIVFDLGDPCELFHVVAKGLVKVSVDSSAGFRITYLMAGQGEPLNLVGPFTGNPRMLSAEAMEDSIILCVERNAFTSFAFASPPLINNIISILGQAVDSANSRMIDMLEKRVDQRLLRVLHTLYQKFGHTLHFTSTELAELAGTTTESTLRAMGHLRKMGIVESGRAEVRIMRPEALQVPGSETFWL